MSSTCLLAGRRALEIFGLPRGPWSVPTFSSLVAGCGRHVRRTWWGWLLPAAALLALVLCRGERRAWRPNCRDRCLDVDTAVLVSRHWLGSFSPDLDVLLALYAVTLASLIGLGIGALEHDLRDVGFGWRQVAAGALGRHPRGRQSSLPPSFASGRFDCPPPASRSLSSALAPSTAGGYRVLWLGDPSVLPLRRLDGRAGSRSGHLNERPARRVYSLQPARLGNERRHHARGLDGARRSYRATRRSSWPPRESRPSWS